MIRPRFVAASVLSAVIGFTPAAEPSVVLPVSFEKLVRSADVVFTGTVVRVDSFRTRTSSGVTIVTRVTFRVERALKGSPPLELTLEFLGGRVGDESLEVSGAPRFRPGDRDVIFARTGVQQISPLVGFNQGRFPVTRDPAGRRLVTTYDGWAFSSVAELGRERRLVSVSPVATLTLEAFEREILRTLGTSGR
jgi:hypothetical protein